MMEVLENLDKSFLTKCHESESLEECSNYFSSVYNFKVLTINIRSIRKNFNCFMVALMRLRIKIDIIILTECWWNPNTIVPRIPGFNSYNTTKYINKCGGVVAYVRDTWSATVTEPEVKDCNCLEISIGKEFRVFGVYRSPAFTDINNFLSSFNEANMIHNNKSCIIWAGDFNLNLIEDPPNEQCMEYMSLAAEHQLVPAISKPTRGNSCLDHIFVKQGFKVVGVVCNSAITDHNICIVGVANSLQPDLDQTRSRLKIDFCGVVDDLKKEDWRAVISNSDVNQAVQEFDKIISSAISTHSRLVTTTRSCLSLKPWITPGLIKCQKNRDTLHLKARKDPNNEILQTTYRRYRNFYKELLHRVKTGYEKEKLVENKNNPKKLWQTINNICDRTKMKTNSTELISMNEDPLASLNRCNNYFANVGKQLAKHILNNISTTENSLANIVKTNNSPVASFFMSPTTTDEISRLITSLKSDSAPGYDGHTATLIKHIKHCILEPLTHIFNLSLESGCFPSTWKIALVVPIHKDGAKEIPMNYRPISLLSIFSKLLEKVVNARLVDYLEANMLLSERQFGFRRGRSAEDAVVLLTKTISSAVDQKLRCMGVFLDLAKAFDTVSIPILTKKLETFGIRGIALDWFHSYLSNRVQKVRVGTSISDELPVGFGVPQGSILGPTLFAIYMNDVLELTIPGANIICYADDTVAVFKDSSWEKVLKMAEEGINQIAEWLNRNLLTLNLKKTKFMTFYNTQRSMPQVNLQMKIYSRVSQTAHSSSSTNSSCDVLGRVDRIRYLGVELDESLTFRHHISKLSGRVRKLIYVMKGLRDSCDSKTLTMIYISLCQSILSYCNLAWGGAAKTIMIGLERAQRAVLKVMLRKPYTHPTDTLYKEAKVLTVRQLFILKAVLSTHKSAKACAHTQDRPNKRVYRIPVQRVNSAFANRHPNSLFPQIYNKIHKIFPNLTNETTRKVKQLIQSWLLTLSYNDTESLRESEYT